LAAEDAEVGDSDVSASDRDESAVLEKEAGNVEPPLLIEANPSTTLETLPDVLNQPAPAEVALATSPPAREERK
jgi:hypothetical protein